MTTRTLEQAIGGELKRLREAAGALQESIALVAQQDGLDWSQATVSAIEAGRRGLSLGELGVLPQIVHAAKLVPTPIRVMDLIPETDEVVVIAGTLQVQLRVARRLFSALPPARKHESLSESLGLSETLSHQVFRAVTEADRKAARKLRTTPTAIDSAARTLWGHGLTQERDRRLGARVTALPPRSLQAVRGRVTLALTREIQQLIKARRRKKKP
jgi:hypothetical protein